MKQARKGAMSIETVVKAILILVVLIGLTSILFSRMRTVYSGFNSSVGETSKTISSVMKPLLKMMGIKKRIALREWTPVSVSNFNYKVYVDCDEIDNKTNDCITLTVKLKEVIKGKEEDIDCDGKENVIVDNKKLFCCKNKGLCIRASVNNEYEVTIEPYMLKRKNERFLLTPGDTFVIDGIDKVFFYEKHEKSEGGIKLFNRRYYYVYLYPKEKPINEVENDEVILCKVRDKKGLSKYFCECNKRLNFKIVAVKGYGDNFDVRIDPNKRCKLNPNLKTK